MKKMRNLGLFGLIAILSVTLAGCGKTNTYTQDQLKTVAQCLTEKGVKMYGTDRCPHCQKQKEMFGDAFKDITFINCDPNNDHTQSVQCQAAGIKGYPTWDYNGTKRPGAQSIESLAQWAGCNLTGTVATGNSQGIAVGEPKPSISGANHTGDVGTGTSVTGVTTSGVMATGTAK